MKTPVYDISDFVYGDSAQGFYSNKLSLHVQQHQHLVLAPHGHDFYLTVLITRGTGTHDIDFARYQVRPGSAFVIRPGQVHHWKLSADAEGYVIFHTAAFYNINFTGERLHQFPFFGTTHGTALIRVPDGEVPKMERIFREVCHEYKGRKLMRFPKIASLVNVLYIELARNYHSTTVKEPESQSQLTRLIKLEELIELHYKEVKLPRDYAAMMNVSLKHLNRTTKQTLNKTVSDLIADRVVLEAKRMLMYGTEPIAKIAAELGYLELAYFFRMFRKRTGLTPMGFLEKSRGKG